MSKQGGRRAPLADRVRVERLVLSGLLLVVLAATWANDWGTFVPDTVPDLYMSPGRLLGSDLSPWQSDPFLGSPQLQAGRVPVDAVLLAVDALGAPPWVAVRLWRLALLILAATGVHRLVRTLAPDQGAAGRVTAAILFVANPYVVVGASTTPTLLPYCLLPWLLVTVVRAARQGSWRWAAGSALVWFAMSGIQVGVVPLVQLVVLPALLVHLRVVERLPRRRVMVGTARCAALWVLVSLYWLLPGFAALGAGSGITASTETTEAINGFSSYAEVVRGLGMWTMYGAGAGGPFQPGFASYLDVPVVIVAAACLPVLAVAGFALSRSRSRLLPAMMIVVAAPLMVGLYPFEDPSWFGRALGWGFDHVPGLVAFRTTNKAGGVLALGVALLVGILAQHLVERLPRRAPRVVASVALAAVVVTACAPAAVGTLYPVRLDLPAYWTAAGQDLDGDPTGRTLVVPGETQARYRWGYTSSADVLTAVTARSTVVRQTVPAGSPEASNFLAAIDVPLNEGRMPAGALSTMAAYLGADSVLVRNDTLWEFHAGARPATVLDQVGQDLGLVPAAAFGAPGENTSSSDPGAQTDERSVAIEEAAVPLLRYDLAESLPRVRSEPVEGSVLIDGDNAAIPASVGAGVLTGRPPYRLLGGLDGTALSTALADGARIVVTDTNQRRTANSARLSSSTGVLLPATEGAVPTRALFGDPDDQTVAVLRGARAVSASQSGSAFGPVPYGGPALVLDGDPASGWVAGDFGSAVGQVLTLSLDRPTTIDEIVLQALPTSPAALTSVLVRAGGVETPVVLDGVRETVVEVPDVVASEVQVEVTGIQGEGENGVGLAELRIPGLPVAAGARLPLTLSRLAADLPAEGRDLLGTVPLDVLLSRDAGNPVDGADDGERVLDRSFRLPVHREVSVSGVLRAGPEVPEVDVDRLAGFDPRVTAVSSSRWFGDLTSRASSAFDADPLTAWVPGEDAVGESVTVSFPATEVSEVVVRQDTPVGDLVDLATGVRIETGDGRVVEADLGPGATAVPLPRGITDRVELTITSRAGTGAVVRITDVEVAEVRMSPDADRAASACVTIGTMDGVPLRATPTGGALVASGDPAAFTGCAIEDLQVAQGDHHLRAAPGWLLDSVRLASAGSGSGRGVAVVPELRVDRTSATSTVVRAGAAEAPWYLVLGQAYDPRWRLLADGRDLGPPVALDGWSTGWRIEELGAQTLEIDYGPATIATLGLLASGAVVAVCLFVVCAPSRRRR